MIDTILQVVYIVIAIAMAVLILLQRGAGAQAGSGFGAGASGTVFGSRGSTNFLAKSTKWLAFAFFCLALFMGPSPRRTGRPAERGAPADAGHGTGAGWEKISRAFARLLEWFQAQVAELVDALP